tara:strand:- start:99 stop:359 length:261 start_codon:yes stop_codon:yes gene_type:complete
LKFKYFLFETINVVSNTNKNNEEIIIGIIKEKYQLILKKFTTKKYEKEMENSKEDIIMGINKIKDSKIINLIIFNFSKPKILKTRF